MNEIEDVVESFGGRQFLECYRDLCVAIEVEMMYLSDRPRMKVICAEVCRRIGKSSVAVSKSLSRAIDDLWIFGEHEIIAQYCRSWGSGKPTPHEFIFAVARKLKREMMHV